MFQLIKKYTDFEQKIISVKDFLTNLLKEFQSKNNLITGSLVYGFCRLLETEVALKKNINCIPFREIV